MLQLKLSYGTEKISCLMSRHYLSQDFQIFDGTIRENILFDRNVPDDEIMMALEKENLSCLVRDSARGLLWN